MSDRACGPCAVCCTLLGVDEIGKPAKAPCLHQQGVGCAIYETRPDSCRRFNCGWLLGMLREGDRPDLALAAAFAIMALTPGEGT